MRNLIYGSILVILALVSASVLVLYYNQDFTEYFDFPDKINYDSMEIQTGFRGEVKYLINAKGDIGSLSLINDGYFKQVYFFPTLVGCIDLKEGIKPVSTNIRNYQFSVNFVKDGLTFYGGQSIELDKEDKAKYNLLGQYSSYDVPLSDFSNNVAGVSIYEIEKRQENPIRDNYYYNNNQYYGDCDSLKQNSEPLAEISLI
ncbi:MAG: hypothetical protein Q7R87_02540 [Nanoarchaeota archaeon]|nr:hypothetical protein [Nanoarchaeota archaeon]